MKSIPDLRIARALSTAELEALAVLGEVRECGAFILIDTDGCMYVHHGAAVPPSVMTRLARYSNEAARLLLGSLQ